MAGDASTDVKSSGLSGSVGTLVGWRWLLLYFIQRQLSQSYRGSFLGVAWLVIGPLLMVALYTLVFSEIIGLRFGEAESASNYGLYIYSGLLPFFAFSETVNKSTNSIRQNAALVQRVVFPLEVLPLATAATAFVTQLFGIAALSALLIFFEGELQWTLLLVPLIAIPQIIFMTGLGLITTVAGAYVPDLRELLAAVTRVMLFASPIIWPASLAYDRGLGFIVDFNPIAVLVESYRDLALEGTLPDMAWLGGFTIFSVALLILGAILFARAKKYFADVI
ncbi:ABC transporter permease [soil metagenome]